MCQVKKKRIYFIYAILVLHNPFYNFVYLTSKARLSSDKANILALCVWMNRSLYVTVATINGKLSCFCFGLWPLLNQQEKCATAAISHQTHQTKFKTAEVVVVSSANSLSSWQRGDSIRWPPEKMLISKDKKPKGSFINQYKKNHYKARDVLAIIFQRPRQKKALIFYNCIYNIEGKSLCLSTKKTYLKGFFTDRSDLGFLPLLI